MYLQKIFLWELPIKKLQNTEIKEITKYNISLQQIFLEYYLDDHLCYNFTSCRKTFI